MKLDKLVGDRFKERPADCITDSHAFMVRGGYIKYVANGIYSSYLPLKKITKKIEQILREEMDKIDGQEVQFPVVMPASLWQESGRYESIGNELLRFKDRNNSDMVLGMTHEEAAVQLVKEYANSYSRYPFMIYQIQTKFRDEPRPRAGLIRVREFTMKDGYSFHTSKEDLDNYYGKCLKAYERIFKRAGLKRFVSVLADSGMMGGSISHEFMLLSPIGEDSIVICNECDYKSNMEAAKSIVKNVRDEVSEDLKEVHTPEQHTIEEVCNFLNAPKEKSCKAVIYQKTLDDSYVVVFIRGDLEINETKLRNYLGCEIYPAVITPESNLAAGFIGPVGIDTKHTILFDSSLENANNMVCGANKADYHYTGLDMARDFSDVEYHDFAKIIEGGLCPRCNKESITISRGIEIGNIFQLGDKYTKSMGMTYLDKNGKMQTPIMGCYGIGVGRLAASICEESHDEYGPIWPITIAPWQVHLCAIKVQDENVLACADKLYKELLDKGVEVIYDDRKISPGVKFSDADLLGVPLRVNVSPRSLEAGVCEILTRDKTINMTIPVDEVVRNVLDLIKQLKDNIENDIEL